ncbi:hypothetical protein [Streptomyces sp. NPDC057257]|uniref:hypothetical protein n=1 Tax=Streptomyces sp. NPDC057257 TaxID=3346071 RepID=UPI00362CEF43
MTPCRDIALPDDLRHEVQAAAFRVVQDALTNVGRHAAWISIAPSRDGELHAGPRATHGWYVRRSFPR